MSAHPWWRWECYENGFYNHVSSASTQRERDKYKAFHTKDGEFERAMIDCGHEWVFSFENFLTNTTINRVAWLGQVSACYAHRLSSFNRGAYNELSKEIRDRQNLAAKNYLMEWLGEYNSKNSGRLYRKVDETRIRERDSRRSSPDIITRVAGPKLQIDMFGNTEQ